MNIPKARLWGRWSAVFFLLLAPVVALAAQLTVALYPWVPDVARFKQAVTTEWAKRHPEVTLNFLAGDKWDGGYDMPPPAEADVYVFDAVYLEYFRSQNWLEALAEGEIADKADFFPYAITGVQSGGRYYGIPQLGCASVLFYRASDAELFRATTLSEVRKSLGQCTYSSEIPPDRRGLMVDMSGSTTDADLYLDAAHSMSGTYPLPLPDKLDPAVVGNLRQVLAMASYLNATKGSDDPYVYAKWWSQGWSRAYVGYTESMSSMTPEARAQVAFKVLPLSENRATPPLFYSDVVGVNTTTVARGSRALAVELANVLASASTLVAAIGPDGQHPVPQYLLASRPSVFETIGRTDPIYPRLLRMVNDAKPVMFKAPDNIQTWLTTQGMKKTIKGALLSAPQCACDFPAIKSIGNNAQAGPICTSTCADHGGWNGNWTNAYPAAQAGSVCGCNACAVQ